MRTHTFMRSHAILNKSNSVVSRFFTSLCMTASCKQQNNCVMFKNGKVVKKRENETYGNNKTTAHLLHLIVRQTPKHNAMAHVQFCHSRGNFRCLLSARILMISAEHGQAVLGGEPFGDGLPMLVVRQPVEDVFCLLLVKSACKWLHRLDHVRYRVDLLRFGLVMQVDPLTENVAPEHPKSRNLYTNLAAWLWNANAKDVWTNISCMCVGDNILEKKKQVTTQDNNLKYRKEFEEPTMISDARAVKPWVARIAVQISSTCGVFRGRILICGGAKLRGKQMAKNKTALWKSQIGRTDWNNKKHFKWDKSW